LKSRSKPESRRDERSARCRRPSAASSLGVASSMRFQPLHDTYAARLAVTRLNEKVSLGPLLVAVHPIGVVPGQLGLLDTLEKKFCGGLGWVIGGTPPDDGQGQRLPLVALLVDGRLRQSLSLNDVAMRVQRAAKAEGRTSETNKKTVSRWEHGETPRPDSLRWLASALNIPLDRAVAAAHLQRAHGQLRHGWMPGIEPHGSGLTASPVDSVDVAYASGLELTGWAPARRFEDVVAVFPSRSDMMSQLPPEAIFGAAQQINAAGLSLNLLCQQFADRRLSELIEAGCTLRCLFLDPASIAMKAREREEGYPLGRLSSLTQLNMDIMLGLRRSLSEDSQVRLEIATYDEAVRFNLLLVDGRLGIVQPYLHARRGVDSPVLVLRRGDSEPDSGRGLLPIFEQAFGWLWERRTPAC